MSDNDQKYSEAETIKRREAALQKMMRTPHQPRRTITKKLKAKPKKTK